MVLAIRILFITKSSCQVGKYIEIARDLSNCEDEVPDDWKFRLCFYFYSLKEIGQSVSGWFGSDKEIERE